MLRTRFLTVTYIIFFLALIVLFFHPLLLSANTLFFRDIHRWFYPMKFFLGEALRNGDIPFWCPHYFCGAPFMSDVQSGVFYPLSVLFVVLPAPLSFNAYILIHLVLAGFFFYLFARRLGYSEIAAMVTSVSYAFGGCTLSAINVLNNLTTLAWLPAVLFSFQIALAHQFRKYFFLPPFFLVLAILGGEPQLFIFTSVLAVVVCFISPGVTSLQRRLKIVTLATAMIALSVGLVLFQIGPMYTDYQYSVRAAGLPFDEAVKNSLPAASLKHLFFPLVFPPDYTTSPETLTGFFPGNNRPPWLLTIYPGFLIAPLAIISLIGRRLKEIGHWLVIFGIALLLALGDNTPFYKMFYNLLPIFRFPEKFLFISNLALLVLAAAGVDPLIEHCRRRKLQPAFVGFFLVTALAADLYISHHNLNPHCSADIYTQPQAHLKQILEDPALHRIYVDQASPPGMSAPRTILDHHARWQLMTLPNLGLIQGLSHTGGTSGLELRYQYFITEILSKTWAEKLLFLKMANVKYIVSSRPLMRDPVLKGLIKRLSPRVYLLESNLPRAWLVGQIKPTAETRLQDFLAYDLDPGQAAMGPKKLSSRYQEPFFSHIDRIEYVNGNRISIQVETDKPAVLVLSESAYPGWKVTVNGEEKEILSLNLFFQGVELGAGRHEIEFVYRPKNFILYLGLSVLSCTLLGLIRRVARTGPPFSDKV